MWRTQYGERTLEGAEAVVFAESLLSLLDEAVQDQLDDDYQLGIACFDNLTYGQKISMLATIGSGLLSKDVAPIELTAVVEGTIATVFQHLKNEIVFEIDTPEIGTQWREQVVAARQEAEGLEIPKPQCDDMKEWEIEVEELSGRILWDADYENAGLYIDHPPEKSKWMKDMSGVSDNYFLAIADDLTEEQAKARIKQLQTLCHSIVGVQ
jgi:hypothetical protein